MRLKNIQLSNYRGHEKLAIEFGARFNVLVGLNGSGKTSVLKAVCDFLSVMVQNMPLKNGVFQPLQGPGLARLKHLNYGGRYRFEPQYPVSVSGEADFRGDTVGWHVETSNEIGFAQITGPLLSQPNQVVHAFSKYLNDYNNTAISLSMVAFYRADRRWSAGAVSEIHAAMNRDSRLDGYSQWWNASADAVPLQLWVIGKVLERFQSSSESGLSFDEFGTDELALVNSALMLACDGVKGLRYDMQQKSLLVEWKTRDGFSRDPTSFENLSDGQRAVISLVSDIARRMCLLNPHLGKEVIAQTPGIVLIDELDLHLHPHWQRVLTTGLRNAFPNIQFIAASHSPQVLGELKPDEIILLRPGGFAHPQVSYGLSSSQVLDEIMETDSRNPEVEDLIAETFEHLERQELPAAREKLDVLEASAPGIPELAGAKSLLRRKEIIGR